MLSNKTGCSNTSSDKDNAVSLCKCLDFAGIISLLLYLGRNTSQRVRIYVVVTCFSFSQTKTIIIPALSVVMYSTVITPFLTH